MLAGQQETKRYETSHMARESEIVSLLTETVYKGFCCNNEKKKQVNRILRKWYREYHFRHHTYSLLEKDMKQRHYATQEKDKQTLCMDRNGLMLCAIGWKINFPVVLVCAVAQLQ
jgi:tRNA A37 threonylcarbamoyladenosine synthetase subunit TsaC/SUA5/YrdC